MSTNVERRAAIELRHELSAIRGNWFWFLLLGIALIALGTIALGYVGIASLAAAVVIGWFIFIGGIAESIGAFWCRAWSGFFWNLLSGILGIVVGLLFLRAPGEALLALTLLIASFLLVEGIFKIVAALMYRFPSWGFAVLSGGIDVILGVMIWQQFPASAIWVIGMFVGISLIFRGVNWIVLALAFKSLPRAETTPTPAPPVVPSGA